MVGMVLVGASIAATLFGVSGLAKLRLSVSVEARWHPVALVRGWSSVTARFVFAASGLLDWLLLCGIVTGRRYACFVAIGAVAAYTAAALTTPALWTHADGCNCFDGVLEAHTRRGLLFRNLAICALLAGLGIAEPATSTPAVVALSAVLIASAEAWAALRRRSIRGVVHAVGQ